MICGYILVVNQLVKENDIRNTSWYMQACQLEVTVPKGSEVGLLQASALGTLTLVVYWASLSVTIISVRFLCPGYTTRTSGWGIPPQPETPIQRKLWAVWDLELFCNKPSDWSGRTQSSALHLIIKTSVVWNMLQNVPGQQPGLMPWRGVVA